MRSLVLPLSLAVLSLGAMLSGGWGDAHLRYDRIALAQGEWWRFLSGQLVHLGWLHLGLNLLGLALVWELVGRHLPIRAWVVAIPLCGLGVGLGLWWLSPEILWYVGLSGCLHGLFAAGAVAAVMRRQRFGWILMAALTAKLAYEQLAGSAPGVEGLIGGRVVTAAHLYGAVAGGLFAVGWTLTIRGAPRGSDGRPERDRRFRPGA